MTAQPSDVATDNVPLIIRGDTMERIHRAVNAFPTRYPDYKTKPPKLDGDVRVWLNPPKPKFHNKDGESALAKNDKESVVFSVILKEHFDF